MSDAFELPPLSMGVMTFGDQVDRVTAASMLDQARAAGLTLFDTADSYHEGASERLLGELMQPWPDEVLVASKVGRPVTGAPTDRGLHPDRIAASIDGTLERLGRDHLDLYYLHQPDPQVPVTESLGAMQGLVEAGKVRAVGVSNFAAWQIADMQAIAAREGYAPIVASQVLYNIVSRRLEDEYVPFAQEHRVATTVYNPLAGGLLTGKYQLDATPTEGRFALSRYRDRYWNAQLFDGVERLSAVASRAGMSLLELAFRWLLTAPAVDSILLGASSAEQLSRNLEVCARGPLPDDVMAACDDVWDIVGGSAPVYNR